MEIRSNNKAKHRSQRLAFGIFRLLSLCIVLILFAILGFIIYKGAGAISWEFITSAPTDGMTGGGIWPAIVGTFYLMVGSALFAFPVGVMSGIYMNEYAPKGKLVRFIRVMTNNLSGIPSIVFGLFGMALFVNYMGFGDSILAGSLTLGLLCVPLVIRTTEEALKAIPDSMREGSRALGATRLQTIWHVILPMGMPNIITGLILALGRADASARKVIEAESLDLRYYSVIYNLIDEVKAAMSGMLSPELKQQIIGLAEVRDVFKSPKFGAIAGCMVTEGVVKRHNPIRVLRDNVVIYEGELESLRRFKDDVNEVRNGMECGIGVKNYNDVRTGDVIEVFEIIEIQRTIA